MLNTFGITSVIVILLIGVVLLYGPVVRQDASQTAQLLVGATLVAFGLLAILLNARDWLEGKRQYKNASKRGRG